MKISHLMKRIKSPWAIYDSKTKQFIYESYYQTISDYNVMLSEIGSKSIKAIKVVTLPSSETGIEVVI